jgi:hypothetical protein
MNTKLLRKLRNRYELKLEGFCPTPIMYDGDIVYHQGEYTIHGGLLVMHTFRTLQRAIQHILFWEFKWVALIKYKAKQKLLERKRYDNRFISHRQEYVTHKYGTTC